MKLLNTKLEVNSAAHRVHLGMSDTLKYPLKIQIFKILSVGRESVFNRFNYFVCRIPTNLISPKCNIFYPLIRHMMSRWIECILLNFSHETLRCLSLRLTSELSLIVYFWMQHSLPLSVISIIEVSRLDLNNF